MLDMMMPTQEASILWCMSVDLELILGYFLRTKIPNKPNNNKQGQR